MAWPPRPPGPVWCCHWFPRTDSGVNIITAFVFVVVVVVAAIVRGGPLELFLRLQFGLALLFNLRWRVPHGPFVGGAMIHDTSTYLFGDNRIEVLFKCGSELVIVGFLGYRCTRARNEVGTLSGNNVEAVLQVRAAVSSMGRNAKLNQKDAGLR